MANVASRQAPPNTPNDVLRGAPSPSGGEHLAETLPPTRGRAVTPDNDDDPQQRTRAGLMPMPGVAGGIGVVVGGMDARHKAVPEFLPLPSGCLVLGIYPGHLKTIYLQLFSRRVEAFNEGATLGGEIGRNRRTDPARSPVPFLASLMGNQGLGVPYVRRGRPQATRPRQGRTLPGMLGNWPLGTSDPFAHFTGFATLRTGHG